MNYSTLQEAYNIDTFEKKKPSQKLNKNNGSMIVSTNTSPSFVESSKLALNSNKLSDFPINSGNSCAPLQAPSYNIPVSNECKKEHDSAMNVYTNINNNNDMMNMMNPVPNNANNPNNANKTAIQSSMTPTASTMTSLNYSASPYNNMKGSSDNVMPYYDEDLEQYFNINNLNDEVKYNSYAYMPNTNNQSYTNNDTSQYTNNSNIPKNGNNLLNNSSYNLTPEEKKNAEAAIQFLKSIEEKINKGDINSDGYNRTSIADPVIPPENTGPGGFKVEGPNKNIETPTEPDVPIKREKSGNNYIYNAIFNISILLIIGIAIILLCDQIVELSIQIGMKRVVNILEPFIKTPVQELVNN
jgi:hypothetical protein